MAEHKPKLPCGKEHLSASPESSRKKSFRVSDILWLHPGSSLTVNCMGCMLCLYYCHYTHFPCLYSHLSGIFNSIAHFGWFLNKAGVGRCLEVAFQTFWRTRCKEVKSSLSWMTTSFQKSVSDAKKQKNKTPTFKCFMKEYIFQKKTCFRVAKAIHVHFELDSILWLNFILKSNPFQKKENWFLQVKK